MQESHPYRPLRKQFLGFNSSCSLPRPSHLALVDLSFNTFNGNLPLYLFSLPRVQKILLSNNNFDGSLVDFSNASASLLETLELSNNRLEGEIPKSFFELQRLSILSLSSNKLRGTVLTEAFQDLHDLTTLDLSYNNLSIETGSGDSSMSFFPQLSSLQLASCNLQMFPNLRNQSSLGRIDLSDNNIGGEIPSWIWGSNNGYISYLNLSHNQLVGLQQPHMFSESLSVLDLHSNKLVGVIPIPPRSAIYIDYSDNLFSSSIPESIGNNLTCAFFFSVSRNLLTGQIPETICNASYLKVLDLSSNGLGGKIPQCLVENGDLWVLNLGNNNLSGPIVGTFTSNCDLQTLDLHGNSLQGKLPLSLANCTMLEVLNLGNNRLNDTYPCFLRHNTDLRVLILRSNKLHGGTHCNPIPFSTWKKLQVIDIAFNNFTGALPPDWFWNWHAMMSNEDAAKSYEKHLGVQIFTFGSFYYDDSVTVTFKGREWELVKVLTLFTSIDISNNHFGGEIPSAIGRLKALHILNVSHNEFTGSIPLSIGDLTQIESLDLSRNKLVGEIPSVLTRLSFLSAFNLSCNQLQGTIPVGSQFQTFTNDSYKGNKDLCGDPLTKRCTRSREATTPSSLPMENHGNIVNNEDFISVEVGFVVGLGIFVLPLIFSKRWNKWYYQLIDRIFLRKLD